jgi:hypothetical protein
MCTFSKRFPVVALLLNGGRNRAELEGQVPTFKVGSPEKVKPRRKMGSLGGFLIIPSLATSGLHPEPLVAMFVCLRLGSPKATLRIRVKCKEVFLGTDGRTEEVGQGREGSVK